MTQPAAISPASAHPAAAAAGAASDHDQGQYLTFMLGREVLAIGILSIREILEYEPPTEVPMMPAFIRGVINLRGAVVPVVDLAARLNRPSAQVGKKTCIVIVEVRLAGDTQVVGIIVDAVNEVLEIGSADIEPPPEMGGMSSARTDYIAGLGKVGGKFIIILRAERVLAIGELADLGTAGAAAAAA